MKSFYQISCNPSSIQHSFLMGSLLVRALCHKLKWSFPALSSSLSASVIVYTRDEIFLLMDQFQVLDLGTEACDPVSEDRALFGTSFSFPYFHL